MARRPWPPMCRCDRAATDFYGRTAFATNVVPIRQRQLRRPTAYVPPPLFARLLRPGKRGGDDVRVRVWLWCVFLAHASGNPVVRLDRLEWGARLHLVRPGGARVEEAAARRVDHALVRLASENLIEARSRNQWQVLTDDGKRQPYQSETEEELGQREARRAAQLAIAPHGQRSVRYTAARRTPDGGRVVRDFWEDTPIPVPVSLWGNGWVSDLSGAALVALLVLLDQRSVSTRPVVVPRIRRSQYDITPSVWRKGRDELTSRGLLRIAPGPTAGVVVRDSYVVDYDRIHTASVCAAWTATLPAVRPRRTT